MYYHDFEPLGFKTKQINNVYKLNQKCKQPILFDYIQKAIVQCKKVDSVVTGLEMFCADCFYGNYAIQQGASYFKCTDIDKQILHYGINAIKRLNHTEQIDTSAGSCYDEMGEFDIVLCFGGLYHAEAPRGLLRKAFSNTRKVMLLQTVYSLQNTKADYFETPAPGLTWGSRFSLDYLKMIVEKAGFDIIEMTTNELDGANRADDRGSAYLYLVPKEGGK